jgi:cell division protein FtsI/penicillin-binding protein 2
MASYPAFDPNLFATGISKEDWNALQGENLRDPLSPLPLFNVAARTAVQPGSTFKMVTATAALESGLDPTRKLKDGGAVKLGNRTYGCLVWNRNRSNHGYINLYEALEVSCNYYFFDIATGRDFSRGVSLGFKDPINIEKITSYAQQYGLGLKTGIEIPETVIPVPSQERKLAQIKAMLRNVLIGRAEIYFEQSLIKDKEKLNKNIMTIVGWTEENPSRNELIRRLGTLGIKENFIETVADLCKYTYFNQATWTTGDELIIAIGQGENAYTPLQMTNYIATIGNEGVHNKVSLIGAIEGKGKVIKEPGKKIAVDEQNLEHIIEGMIDNIIQSVTEKLSSLPYIEGIVLGGSRARGTHTEDSDIDFGIYYNSELFDITVINQLATELDDENRSNLIVPPGAWGDWINGGGWLVINGYHVDLILRDIKRVVQIIKDTEQGIATANYQTGHPHGYISAMYRGELAISKILYANDENF